MTDTTHRNPHPPEFERFLYAPVGMDRNGYAVTVLSTLARLGFDPWNEASDLVTLGREAAGVRLGLLLSRFRDVPELKGDHDRIARELTQLLPKNSSDSLQQAASSVGVDRLASSRTIWALLAILLFLAQILFSAAPGTGG